MPHLAFLTIEDYDGLAEQTASISLALQPHGVTMECADALTIELHADRFDGVVFQTASGYHKDYASFLSILERLEAKGLTLINSADLIRWNSDKTYLRSLEKKGHRILPTLWFEKGGKVSLPRIQTKYGWQDMVMKPTISAGAHLTKRVQPHQLEQADAWLKTQVQERAMMVQPFAPEIETEGEWSFLFFDGTFSHCLLKTPQSGDYRVQHVHGGHYEHRSAPESLLEQAEAVLQDIPSKASYARVDGIVRNARSNDMMRNDSLLVMEVELIEPYLFLKTCPEAVTRYASALARALETTKAKAA
jgi:glutathione synthase/RimK-type ligase-like ATP-grasp enzyme